MDALYWLGFNTREGDGDCHVQTSQLSQLENALRAELGPSRQEPVHKLQGTTACAKQCCLASIKKHSDSSSDDNVIEGDPDGDLSLELTAIVTL